MKYDVVIFGMNKYRDWQVKENRNRNYYVLNEILKRPDVAKVLYVDYLPIRRKEALRDYFFLKLKWFSQVKHRTLFSICQEILPNKFYRYSTVFSVISWNYLYNDLKKVLHKLGFNNLLLWSYYPLNVDFFELFEKKITVFDIDSDWQQKSSLRKGKKIDYIDVLRKNYNSMANQADYIFTASDALLEIFMGHDRSFWLPDRSDWGKLVNEMFNIINKH